MDQRSTITLIRALKGAPWTILIALLAFPDRPLGTTDLVRITSYSDKTVKKALDALSDQQLAQRHGRYHGWTATHRCRQMILGELAEPENFRLPASSSSSHEENRDPPIVTTTTTTTQPEKLRLPNPVVAQRLQDSGIFTDIAQELALDPWITVDIIDAWIQDLNQQEHDDPGRIRSPAGILVRNLRAHRQPPDPKPKRASQNWMCHHCWTHPCICEAS